MDTCLKGNKHNQTSNSIKVKISVLHGLCDVTDYILLDLAQLLLFENKILIFGMTALQQLISHWGQNLRGNENTYKMLVRRLSE